MAPSRNRARSSRLTPRTSSNRPALLLSVLGYPCAVGLKLTAGRQLNTGEDEAEDDDDEEEVVEEVTKVFTFSHFHKILSDS